MAYECLRVVRQRGQYDLSSCMCQTAARPGEHTYSHSQSIQSLLRCGGVCFVFVGQLVKVSQSMAPSTHIRLVDPVFITIGVFSQTGHHPGE
jgi:hypothetical protein